MLVKFQLANLNSDILSQKGFLSAERVHPCKDCVKVLGLVKFTNQLGQWQDALHGSIANSPCEL